MDSAQMRSHVRNILRDVQSDYLLGEFWDDREVWLALNVSQDLFVNYCLTAVDKQHLLQGLVRDTGYVTAINAALPSDYLHYISAKIGPTLNSQKIARVYLGGEAYEYQNVSHTAALITNNTYTMIYDGAYTNGTLYYYKYPSYIGLAVLGDFDDYIYINYIASQAAVLLAVKEVYNQRDLKTIMKYYNELVKQPQAYANYPINNDVPATIIRKLINNANTDRGRTDRDVG